MYTIILRCLSVCLCYSVEHEMENKLQDHKQELQRMDQSLSLDKEKLVVESDLKKKEKEVCVKSATVRMQSCA